MNLFRIPLAGFFVWMLAASCNPGKRMAQQVHNRDAQGRETKIEYPKAFVATPENINMVYDFEQIFTPDQVRKLDSTLRVFEKSNLIPIKLVTLGADRVAPDQFDRNNKSLLKEWDGVHGKSEKGMTISISKAFNKAAIHFGTIAGKQISQDEANQIITTVMLPSFENGQYYLGTWNGINSVMDVIRKNIKF